MVAGVFVIGALAFWIFGAYMVWIDLGDEIDRQRHFDLLDAIWESGSGGETDGSITGRGVKKKLGRLYASAGLLSDARDTVSPPEPDDEAYDRRENVETDGWYDGWDGAA